MILGYSSHTLIDSGRIFTFFKVCLSFSHLQYLYKTTSILRSCGVGNSNLVYTIIRKRTIFHQLANLATDHSSIAKALTKRSRKSVQSSSGVDELPSMEGSVPASEAEPGTLQATLAATPGNSLVLTVQSVIALKFEPPLPPVGHI